jgi:hypothetical protein
MVPGERITGHQADELPVEAFDVAMSHGVGRRAAVGMDDADTGVIRRRVFVSIEHVPTACAECVN